MSLRNVLTADLIIWARSQLHVRELRDAAGNWTNDSPEIRSYMRSVGAPSGVAWCAGFAYYGVDLVTARHKVDNPLVRTAWCPTIKADARTRGILHTRPQAGDMGLLLNSNGEAFHVYYVVAVDGDWVRTIEGNTNTAGSPEGIGVFERTRSVSSSVYVRWLDLIPEPQAAIPAPYQLVRSGKVVAEMPVIDSRSWIKLRDWSTVFGEPAPGWTGEAPILGDWSPPVWRLIGNLSYVPVTDLLDAYGIGYTVDNKARRVTVG